MNLHDFLNLCDDYVPVIVRNLNGVGGARFLASPDEGCTAKDVLDEYGGAAYSVESIGMHQGRLYIDADEHPWDFGSYWDGEWYGEPTKEYEVHVGATVHVREPNDGDAIIVARAIVAEGDADLWFEIANVN